MHRTLLKVVAAALAVALLVLVALAVALPRIVASESVAARLRARASEALGAPVDWRTLEVAVLPPRIVLEGATVGGDDATREAGLSVEAIDLRLGLGGLLRGRLEIGSLVLRGSEIVATRTPEGLVLPWGGGPPDAAADVDGTAEPAPEDGGAGSTDGSPGGGGGGAALALAVQRIGIEGGVVVLRDRTLSPPVEWRLEDVEASARGSSLDAPIAVEARARLAAGDRALGRVAVSGEVSLDGLFDLAVELDQLALGASMPLLPDWSTAAAGADPPDRPDVDGLLSGRVSLAGGPSVLEQVDVDVVVAGLSVRGGGLDLAGDLEVEARQALGEPVAFVADLDLARGGRARAEGTLDLAGSLEAGVDLRGLDVAPWTAFATSLGAERLRSGRATGRVDVAVEAERGLTRLETDLRIEGARVVEGELDVAGDVDLEVAMAGVAAEDPIRFDVGVGLAGGGRLEARGTATPAGAVDARARVESVSLGLLRPWVREGTTLSGALTGRLDLGLRPDRTLERLDTDLRIESGRIVRPPVDLSGGLALVAKKAPGAEPIELRADLALGDGGRVSIAGTATLGGRLDVDAEIEALDLAIAEPFLPGPTMRIGGRATGTGRLAGVPTAPEFVGLDVAVETGRLRIPDYSVEGPYRLVLEVLEPLSDRRRGKLELDLTAAEVAYADRFRKAAGTRAELSARFVPNDRGELVFESRLRLRDVDEILMQGAVGEKVSVTVTTPTFELEGWEALLPDLEPWRPSGPIAFEGLGVEIADGRVAGFGGRIQLRGVGLRVPDVGEVRLRGQVVGEGPKIRTEGLRLRLHGAVFAVRGEVVDPLDAARFELDLRSEGDPEVNVLLNALTSVRDTLYGPLSLDASLRGSAASEAELYGSLAGRAAFTIGRDAGGRLEGVSLLRAVLDQIPLVGGAARLSQSLRRGRSVDDYLGERFEIIEGDFVVGGGEVEARTLRLAYEGYEVRLSGPMRLEDLSIDMTGEIALKSDLVSAIAGLAGAPVEDREPIRIPLARVTRTLVEPRVEMTAETLAAVPKLLLQGAGLDTLTIGIGKALGRAIRGGEED